MKKILIVVDMQNDFVTGPLGSPEARAIVPKIREKIIDYLHSENEVIFTHDTHYDDYLSTSEGKYLPVEHCIRGTYGWDIVNKLEVTQCKHIGKPTFGYLHWNGILELLIPYNKGENVEIELVGVCTDICVVSNALILKATFPEAKIIVDASCCAGVTPEKHAAALEVMKSCQIEVINE